MKKITVVGLGYVGLSNLLLLAPHHQLTGLEIDIDKLNKLKAGQSPLKDKEIETYLEKYVNDIQFTDDLHLAFDDAELIIIATPTDYDEGKNYFDTSSVTGVIKKINTIQPKATIVIKSTIPLGFTEKVKNRYPNLTIIFSPEFLRESKALYDNLYPSRIVVGSQSEKGKQIAAVFKSAALKKDIPILCTGSEEAEAIKLFANNYLAMRVAFFNELDSFALKNNLNTKDVINGISSDTRIGKGYNNPSFGYGGYCLPKDTKQLLANFNNVPQNLIQAIIDSNQTRKMFIANTIKAKNPKVVGIYRLCMKEGSDNFRSSSILDIMQMINSSNVKIIIYEPTLYDNLYEGFDVENDLNKFANKACIIVANRNDSLINKFKDKLFSRDIFNTN